MDKARNPIRKPIGGIERTNDQPWAQDRCARGEALRNDGFARRFERTVVLRDVLVVKFDGRQQRRRFVLTRTRGACVNRHG